MDCKDKGKYTDEYPGDAEFTRIVQEIYHSVLNDRIDFTDHWLANSLNGYPAGSARDRIKRLTDKITGLDNAGTHPLTRDQLCAYLSERYNTGKTSDMRQTNAEFSGCGELAGDDICRALKSPDTFPAGCDWGSWAGTHRGTWYDIPLPNDPNRDRSFNDTARWSQPRKEPTKVPGDVDGGGHPRKYDFQPVEWPGRCDQARHGWNQSHPDVDYVWGWDPKELSSPPAAGSRKGEIGASVGFPFKKGDCCFIVWITKGEAFLESIGPGGKKTSTGLTGFGQWLVS